MLDRPTDTVVLACRFHASATRDWIEVFSSLIGLGIGAGSATTSSSGQKRRRDERLDGGSRLKRSKSDGSHASATNVYKDDQPDAIGAPSIQETLADSLADCRNDWQRNNVDSIQEAGATCLRTVHFERQTVPNFGDNLKAVNERTDAPHHW
jgi:hypothetical protein